MVARRRKIDRDEITYAIIFIVEMIATLLCLSYLLSHKIPVIYIVFSWIIIIVWVIPFLTSFVIFALRLDRKYLWQVPPLLKKRIIAGLSFLALFPIIIVVLISYITLIVTTLISINIVPPLTKSFSIVNATLTMYKLSHCYKVCGGISLNQTAISPVGSNETMFVKAALSQSFVMLFIEAFTIIVILLVFWLPTIPLLKKLLEYSTGDKEKAYDTLCRDDRWLLGSYMAMTLITYFTGFGIVVYSLAILSSSEFPYAYAMLITTFLVLIAEVLMIHNGGTSSPWLWVALLISVVSSLLYTVAAFYIGGFILPSTCFTGANDALGMYESSLLLAGISGAIPYALTLSIIHHRIMCPRVETEKTGQRSVGRRIRWRSD